MKETINLEEKKKRQGVSGYLRTDMCGDEEVHTTAL